MHLHVDDLGFVWVNLDAAEVPETSWNEQFLGVDTQERLKRFNIGDYIFDEAWSLDECRFNWKTLVENYNEVGKNTPPLETLLTQETVLPLLDCPPRHRSIYQ